MDVNTQVTRFLSWYGAGLTGDSPTASQWSAILGRPADKPVTLINLFKFCDRAQYAEGDTETPDEISGQDAFGRYAAVSLPAMERAGGKFLHVGPAEGTFLGDPEDWDLIAIGAYPDLKALITLYSDPSYREAFHHRTAACRRQQVFVSGN